MFAVQCVCPAPSPGRRHRFLSSPSDRFPGCASDPEGAPLLLQRCLPASAPISPSPQRRAPEGALTPRVPRQSALCNAVHIRVSIQASPPRAPSAAPFRPAVSWATLDRKAGAVPGVGCPADSPAPRHRARASLLSLIRSPSSNRPTPPKRPVPAAVGPQASRRAVSSAALPAALFPSPP